MILTEIELTATEICWWCRAFKMKSYMYCIKTPVLSTFGFNCASHTHYLFFILFHYNYVIMSCFLSAKPFNKIQISVSNIYSKTWKLNTRNIIQFFFAKRRGTMTNRLNERRQRSDICFCHPSLYKTNLKELSSFTPKIKRNISFLNNV